MSSSDTKKPTSDRPHIRKKRTCLMCASEFHSEWSGERICKACKSTDSWRSGGIAA